MSYAGRVKALSVTVASVAMALTSCSGAQHKPPRTRMSAKQIAERSKPAIVRIESTVARGEQVGTGFAVDASGIIATNLHVVAGSSDIKVILLDGTSYRVERVLGIDPARDLALLDINVDAPMPALILGDSDLMETGDPVVAIGNPLGVFDYTVSDGLISSIRVANDQLTLLQTSAPISQGSSGGPLFNAYGEVIGVATAIATDGQNLNFAVPSKYLVPMIQAPRPLSLAEFVVATTFTGDEGPRIIRDVPAHDLAVLDGCSDAQLIEVAKAIAEAIELGAPLYNEGNHLACFKIYEGTAAHYAADAGCAGVRQAFTDGIARAATVQSATEKAWALRDTFDGLLKVIVAKAAPPGSAPP